MIKYIPSENIIYKTDLDSKEVLKRICKIMEPINDYRNPDLYESDTKKLYKGDIEGNSFKISRIIDYRNSFLPVIEGTVEDAVKGSVVKVTMRLGKFVKIFMIMWYGGLGVGLPIGVFLLFKNNFDSISFSNLVPLILALFGSSLVFMGFKSESSISKKYLAELFEAEIENLSQGKKL